MSYTQSCRVFPTLLFAFLFAAGQLFSQESTTEVTVCQGETSPQDWVNYIRPNEEVQGITVVVNTSGCKFDTVPHYIATLEAQEGNHWYITGSPSVYNPTAESFKVYVRFIDRPSEEPLVGSRELMNPLNVDGAREIGLKLRWTAICAGDCKLDSGTGGDDGTTNIDFVPPQETENTLFQVSPNPVTDLIHINTTQEVDRFILTSASGEVIGTYSTQTIDVAHLPAGTYFLKGEVGRKFAVTKVVKQ